MISLDESLSNITFLKGGGRSAIGIKIYDFVDEGLVEVL